MTRINLRRARAFATAVGTTAKTDPLDAALLARMAPLVQAPVPAPDPLREQLRRLAQRRDQRVQQRDDERRRLPQATLALVRECLIEQIGSLHRRIQRMDQAIKRLRHQRHDALADSLSAVPGIGEVTTASLMASLPELGTLDRRQIAALVGLAPYTSTGGNAASAAGVPRSDRCCTWRAGAWCARRPRSNSTINRSGRCGKPAKVAITACMRVLLIRLNAMARDHTPWRDANG